MCEDSKLETLEAKIDILLERQSLIAQVIFRTHLDYQSRKKYVEKFNQIGGIIYEK